MAPGPIHRPNCDNYFILVRERLELKPFTDALKADPRSLIKRMQETYRYSLESIHAQSVHWILRLREIYRTSHHDDTWREAMALALTAQGNRQDEATSYFKSIEQPYSYRNQFLAMCRFGPFCTVNKNVDKESLNLGMDYAGMRGDVKTMCYLHVEWKHSIGGLGAVRSTPIAPDLAPTLCNRLSTKHKHTNHAIKCQGGSQEWPHRDHPFSPPSRARRWECQ